MSLKYAPSSEQVYGCKMSDGEFKEVTLTPKP